MKDDLEPAGEEASDNEGDEDNEEYETMTVTDAGDNFNEQVGEQDLTVLKLVLNEVSVHFQNRFQYDKEEMNILEEMDTLNKMKAAKMDQMFPDEVDTPLDKV